jgi:hypothetical protein
MPSMSQENIAQFLAERIQNVFLSRWASAARMRAKGTVYPTYPK